MRHSLKLARPYLSEFHEEEVQRARRLKDRQVLLDEQKRAVAEGKAMYRYPDGTISQEPQDVADTKAYLDATHEEFPQGVVDLRGRQDKQRTPMNIEHGKFDVPPVQHVVVPKRLDRP